MLRDRRTLALLALLAGCSAPSGGPEPEVRLAPGDVPDAYALHCAKVLTMDGEDRVFAPGTLIFREGVLEYVGERVETPPGYLAIERPDLWAYPGLVDLHTHIHSGLWGRQADGYADDINDSVHAANPELRTGSTVVPSNPWIRHGCAGGVTTLFGHPGSGSSISGFGVLYKSKTDAGYEEIVLRDPGGMKVAQTHNPERAGDLGGTRAGLYWLLRDVNDKAMAAREQGRFDPGLENLGRVHAGELPVLIHCAAEGVAHTARMWRSDYPTRSVLSHGSFDGWKQAEYVASLGMPVNHGPRTTDFFSTRSGRIENTAAHYVEAGVPDFSLNTDSRIVPEHELFVQGTVSARLGLEAYDMLRALTIHPARSFGIEDRVGSLEVGKDADIVLHTGDLLDPRERVEAVLIDGALEYSRARDGQWF